MRLGALPPVSSRLFRAESQKCEDGDMESVSGIPKSWKKRKRSAGEGRMVDERWAWMDRYGEDSRLAAARRRDWIVGYVQSRSAGAAKHLHHS